MVNTSMLDYISHTCGYCAPPGERSAEASSKSYGSESIGRSVDICG